jgi:RNase P subunit RPR2
MIWWMKLLAFWYTACCRRCEDGNDVPETLRTNYDAVVGTCTECLWAKMMLTEVRETKNNG